MVLMGRGGAQGVTVVLMVERAVVDLSEEGGGKVEPSKLRQEWAGTFFLPTDITWRCAGRWAHSEALVRSPVAGGVVSPARVARCWAALALTFILAAGPRRRRRWPPGAGAADEEVVAVAGVDGGDTSSSLVLVTPLLVVTDRVACPPDSSTFLKMARRLVNSSPISAADI